MQHILYGPKNQYDFLVFEPEDWSEDEWKTILKIFGFKEAESIIVRNYRIKAYATPTPEFRDMRQRTCGFCGFDRGPRMTKPEQCLTCTSHSNFQVKQRMTTREKYEYEMWGGE
jgi:hypothetical protein